MAERSRRARGLAPDAARGTGEARASPRAREDHDEDHDAECGAAVPRLDPGYDWTCTSGANWNGDQQPKHPPPTLPRRSGRRGDFTRQQLRRRGGETPNVLVQRSRAETRCERSVIAITTNWKQPLRRPRYCVDPSMRDTRPCRAAQSD